MYYKNIYSSLSFCEVKKKKKSKEEAICFLIDFLR